MRFLLVDSIVELERGTRAVGVKNVTMSEDFLTDHFPHRPIMPGSMIVESMVQLADWVVREATDFRQLGLATSFDNLKFRRVVQPGRQLRVEVKILERGETEASVQGRAYTLDTLVASASFTLALEPIERYLDPAEARRVFLLLCPPPEEDEA
jgi:3-hydroxymyristoyl/3-hydroxydecanoyl-(acyl carrier protein) dehydratase